MTYTTFDPDEPEVFGEAYAAEIPSSSIYQAFVEDVPGLLGASAPTTDSSYSAYGSHMETIMASVASAVEPTGKWQKIMSDVREQMQAHNLKPTISSLTPSIKKFEYGDDRHRMGDWLEICSRKYEKAVPTQNPDFFTWLKSLRELEVIMMLSDTFRAFDKMVTQNRDGKQITPATFAHHNLKPSIIKAFFTGVKYLDTVGRKSYRLKSNDSGLAIYNHALFSTANMETVLSGRGTAIWVVGTNGKMYVGNHIGASFHHSSFLAGGDITCGGEIRAKDGKIQYLTAKSGHYQPEILAFATAITAMKAQGFSLTDTKLAVWPVSSANHALLLPANDLLANQSKYLSWGSITPEQKLKIQRGDFNNF